MTTRSIALSMALLCAAALGASASNYDALIRLKSARAQATSVVAQYLDPSSAPSEIRSLDEQVVACEVTISDVTDVAALFDALSEGIESGPTEVPECWEPRHALIVPSKQEVKVTICFACAQGVMREGESLTGFTVSKSGEVVFDRVFQRHGLRKPKEKKPNQALQPTPMLVTPRANARVAPSTGVADL